MTTEQPVVIVTGGAQGIGFGIGRCFAKRHAHIVIADMNLQAAEQAAKSLEDGGASECLPLACDVSDADDVAQMAQRVMSNYGRIDALINNAGICPFVDIMKMDPATWRRSLEVNLTGPFLCSQAVAKHMIERGQGGSIVCITSLSDSRASGSQVDYAASKSGLRMFAMSLAVALGPHQIRVNAVAPGHVRTALTQHHWDSDAGQEQIPEIIPLQRLGKPEDIGEACAFLCSPEGSYLSGITIRVDGGNSVMP